MKRSVFLVVGACVLVSMGVAGALWMKRALDRVNWPKGSPAEAYAVRGAFRSMGLSESLPHKLLFMNRDSNVLVFEIQARIPSLGGEWTKLSGVANRTDFERRTEHFVDRATLVYDRTHTIVAYRSTQHAPELPDPILESALSQFVGPGAK